MVCLFIEIIGVEVRLLQKYGRVKNCHFEDISNNVFTLTAWKIAIRTDQQRLIFKVIRPVEVTIQA